MASYKIKSGDTLSAIAKRNNTTIKAIMAMNPSIKDPNKIRAGATLKMAAKGISGDSSMDESAPKNKKVNPYAGQSKKEMSAMDMPKKKKMATPKPRPKRKARPDMSMYDAAYASAGKIIKGR